MPSYYTNRAVFALPERDFADRTVHVLESKLPGGDALGVIVLPRPMEEGKSLRELVEGQVAEDKKRLSGFTILEQSEAAVAGVPAILLRSRWRNEGSVLYQLQAHLAVGWTWMLFAVTAPMAERAACDETFEGILASLTWRSG